MAGDRAGLKPPFKGKLQVEAWEAGRAARAAGKARDALPVYAGARRSLEVAWLRGWDEVAQELADELRAERARAEAERPPEPPRPLPPNAVWPEDRPLPTKYHRPPVPCPTCRRLLTDDGGRAVVLKATHGGIAYFRCRATKDCPEFKLPVER